MTSVNDWGDLLPDTVELAEFSGRDTYGVPAFGTPASYSARVSYRPTKVRTADGREVVARGAVWMMGNPDIDPEDRIVLPSGENPPILSVERPGAPEGGAHHTKVYFG